MDLQQTLVDISGLIRRCLANDDVARAEFLTHFSPLIERSVAFRLAQMTHPRPPVRGDVEDIRNDIIEKLLRDNCSVLAKVRDAEKINAWLVTLCKNATVDYVRKHKHRMRALELNEEHETLPTLHTPESVSINAESAEILGGFLQDLPPRQRLVLELHYAQGLKYAEIAEIMNQNINTVAAHIHRAKARLRELMEPIRHEL